MGSTENVATENAGPSKIQRWKMHEWKIADKMGGGWKMHDYITTFTGNVVWVYNTL